METQSILVQSILPQDHTHPAGNPGLLPTPFAPQPQDAFSKQITTGERKYGARAAEPPRVNTTCRKQLSKPFRLCASAPN